MECRRPAEGVPAPVGGWVLVAIYLGAQLAAALLALGLPRSGGAVWGLGLRMTLFPAALLLAGMAAVGGRARRVWGPLGGRALAAGAAAGLGLKLLADLLAACAVAVLGHGAANNPAVLHPRAFAPLPARLLLLGAAGVLAPLAEELFFRGLLYGWLRRRLPPALAASLDGILFGLAHLVPPFGAALVAGLTLALPLAVVGAGLCLLYERQRTLWAPAAAHALVNGSALLLAFASR